MASLPNPLAEFSACECKGKIYVMGGYTTRGKAGVREEALFIGLLYFTAASSSTFMKSKSEQCLLRNLGQMTVEFLFKYCSILNMDGCKHGRM